MGQPVRLNGMKALEIENRLNQPVAGRVTVHHRHKIGAECLAKVAVCGNKLAIHLPDQLGGNLLMREALRQALHNDALQRVMIQNRGENETGQFGLMADHLLRLLPHARQNRVILAKANDVFAKTGMRLLLRHKFLLSYDLIA